MKIYSHLEARDRSYGVRQVLANRLGKREHQDFQCRVPVTLDNGHELTLLSTSNAGFEGITGHFVDVIEVRLPEPVKNAYDEMTSVVFCPVHQSMFEVD